MIYFFKRVIISTFCVILSLPLISHPVFADETTYLNYRPMPISDRQVNAYYVSNKDRESFNYKFNELKASYVGPDTVERQKLGIDILQNFLNTLKKYKVYAYLVTDEGYTVVNKYHYVGYDPTSFSANTLTSVVPGIPSSFNNPDNNFSQAHLLFNIVGKNISKSKMYSIFSKHFEKVNFNKGKRLPYKNFGNFYPKPYTPIQFVVSSNDATENSLSVSIDTQIMTVGNHAGGDTPIVNPGVMHPWK